MDQGDNNWIRRNIGPGGLLDQEENWARKIIGSGEILDQDDQTALEQNGQEQLNYCTRMTSGPGGPFV